MTKSAYIQWVCKAMQAASLLVKVMDNTSINERPLLNGIPQCIVLDFPSINSQWCNKKNDGMDKIATD